MPRLNLSQTPDPDSYDLLPIGEYLCILGEVLTTRKQKDDAGNDCEVPRVSKDGSEQWGLKWVVAVGKHRGRYIFDNVTFSAGGQKRVKLVLKRLGFNVDKDLDLTPEMLLGKNAKVSVVHGMGQTGKKREEVPFSGYGATTAEEAEQIKSSYVELVSQQESQATADGVDEHGEALPF